jgi:hypothetical protein
VDAGFGQRANAHAECNEPLAGEPPEKERSVGQ